MTAGRCAWCRYSIGTLHGLWCELRQELYDHVVSGSKTLLLYDPLCTHHPGNNWEKPERVREVEEALKLPQNLGKTWTTADSRGNLVNMVPRSPDVNLQEFQKLFPHLKPIDAPIDFTNIAEEKKAEHEELVKKARAHDLEQAYKKYLFQKEREQKELMTQKLLDEKMKPLIEEANRKRDYDPLVGE
jgi:hypothetical protein